MFSYFADNRSENSVASQQRRKRLKVFLDILEDFSGQANVLDVGGRPEFWEKAFQTVPALKDKVHITLINLESHSPKYSNITATTGDATHMPQYADNQFDVVFSNSTIEHVGTYKNQEKMAHEIRRVGKRYAIQTPNLYFPIEPHFVFPLFQFLPIYFRAWLSHNFRLGWRGKYDTFEEALEQVKSIRLLSKKEFQVLFPDAKIYEEKFLGIVKSFVAYK